MTIRFNDSYIISLDFEYVSEGVRKLIGSESGLCLINSSEFNIWSSLRKLWFEKSLTPIATKGKR